MSRLLICQGSTMAWLSVDSVCIWTTSSMVRIAPLSTWNFSDGFCLHILTGLQPCISSRFTPSISFYYFPSIDEHDTIAFPVLTTYLWSEVSDNRRGSAAWIRYATHYVDVMVWFRFFFLYYVGLYSPQECYTASVTCYVKVLSQL